MNFFVGAISFFGGLFIGILLVCLIVAADGGKK